MFKPLGFTIVSSVWWPPSFRAIAIVPALLYDVQAEGAFLCAGDPSSDLPAGRLPEDHAGPFKNKSHRHAGPSVGIIVATVFWKAACRQS